MLLPCKFPYTISIHRQSTCEGGRHEIEKTLEAVPIISYFFFVVFNLAQHPYRQVITGDKRILEEYIKSSSYCKTKARYLSDALIRLSMNDKQALKKLNNCWVNESIDMKFGR